jgi:dolichol-phosphate mannosyltransferase
MQQTLVFIPTYNEKGNVERLAAQLLALPASFDILFVDDASPDGTGAVLDALAGTNAHMAVIHRSGKLGIGSAHLVGIRYAYDHGYRTLITMDCDGTHPPEKIPEFLANANGHDVLCGSRYLLAGSLAEWTWQRRLMTRLGHLLTRTLLGIRFDASSAYRLYNLKRVPRAAFERVQAMGYGFFFESLYILQLNGMRIGEIGIHLPARGAGHSKMSLVEAARGIWRLFKLCAEIMINREKYLLR